MEKEETRLSGNRYAYFVRELESACSLEVFFVEENLNVTLKLRLVGCGKTAVHGDIALENGDPFRGERLGPQALAFSFAGEHTLCYTGVENLAWCPPNDVAAASVIYERVLTLGLGINIALGS